MNRFFLIIFSLMCMLQPVLAIIMPAEYETSSAWVTGAALTIEPTYTVTVVFMVSNADFNDKYDFFLNNSDVVVKTVFKKDNQGQWHSTQIMCPLPIKYQPEGSTAAILDLLDENKIEGCTIEEGVASNEMINYIFSLIASFKLFNADFVTDCPGLLKLYGSEILEFLRTRHFFIDEDNLFTITLSKDDSTIDLIITKATDYEKSVYLSMQKIKEITYTQA